MFRLTTLAALAFAFLAWVPANAAPLQQSVRTDGTFQLAQNWGERVCCKRGWQDWWTTKRQCRRAGGRQTANRECRDDWNEQWDNRWWSWGGGNWNSRVCCKRGNRDWWTTALECRNAYGYQTANRECRDDRGDRGDRWDDRWDSRWRNQQGDWNRRVCCKQGRRDWWTTARECRNIGGYETANRECRRD